MSVIGAIAVVVLWVIAGLFALLIVAAGIPFDARYRNDGSAPDFRVTWLGGSVVLYPRSGSKHDNGDDPKRNKKRRSRRKRGGANRARRRAFFELVRDPVFRHELIGAVIRMLRRIEIREVDLTVDLGLDDAAATGVAVGFVSAVAGALGLLRPDGITVGGWRRVRVVPVFDRAVVSVRGETHVRIVPLRVVGTTLSVVVGPVGRRVLGTLWRSRNG